MGSYPEFAPSVPHSRSFFRTEPVRTTRIGSSPSSPWAKSWSGLRLRCLSLPADRPDRNGPHSFPHLIPESIPAAPQFTLALSNREEA